MLIGQSLANELPKFSWDTVPVYAHFGTTGGMSEAEIEFIATRYDFITLEKLHGAKLHYGLTEPQTFADVAKIKKINPDAQVLFYWNLLLDYPAYKMSNERQSNDNWFIHNVSGDLHLKGKIKLKYYDLSNRDFQRWWTSSAAKALKEGKIVILKAWPGFTWSDADIMKLPVAELQKRAQENITFPLDAFLIAANENSYFNYTWGYRDKHGAYDWYPEYDRKLGPPLSDASQNGFEYRREFKHVSVTLNIESKQAKII